MYTLVELPELVRHAEMLVTTATFDISSTSGNLLTTGVSPNSYITKLSAWQ